MTRTVHENHKMTKKPKTPKPAKLPLHDVKSPKKAMKRPLKRK